MEEDTGLVAVLKDEGSKVVFRMFNDHNYTIGTGLEKAKRRRKMKNNITLPVTKKKEKKDMSRVENVAPYHVVIDTFDGGLHIKNLSGVYGLSHNGDELKAHQEYSLADGDKITVGPDYVMRVYKNEKSIQKELARAREVRNPSR